MTIDQKVEAYRMRLEGSTLQSIADTFGVSKERIRQILPGKGRSWTEDAVLSKCAYPVIAQWLFDNRLNYSEFGGLIGCSQATVSRWMNGVHNLNKPAIDKILEVTGMTYEQAFGEPEAPRPEVAEGAQ